MTLYTNNAEIKQSLSEAIIAILAKEYPLRIKAISDRLKEHYMIKVSFQAVRKSLLTLVREEKVTKKEAHFEINKKWAKNLKILTDALVKNYFVGESPNKPPMITKIGNDFQSFSFENSLQTDKFLGTLLLDIAGSPGKKLLCIQAVHWWYFLGHLGTESSFCREMQLRGTKIHYLSFGKPTFLDKMAKKFYYQHTVKFNLQQQNLDKNCELIAIDDFVMRVQYPDNFIKKLEDLFRQTSSIEKLNYRLLGELIEDNFGGVTLTIFKDKTIAQGIRDRFRGIRA